MRCDCALHPAAPPGPAAKGSRLQETKAELEKRRAETAKKQQQDKEDRVSPCTASDLCPLHWKGLVNEGSLLWRCRLCLRRVALETSRSPALGWIGRVWKKSGVQKRRIALLTPTVG